MPTKIIRDSKYCVVFTFLFVIYILVEIYIISLKKYFKNYAFIVYIEENLKTSEKKTTED